MSEMEFIRRRVAGGSLYALLEQESKDYLRPGAFTDADMELLGKALARVCFVRCYYCTVASDKWTPFTTISVLVAINSNVL